MGNDVQSMDIPSGKTPEVGLAIAHPMAARVAQIAKEKSIKLVLVGSFAVNLYSSKPRFSLDVDFLCAKPKRLTALLEDEIPEVEIVEHGDVTQALMDGEAFADFLHLNAPLLQSVFESSTKVRDWYQPSAEGVLAMKYFSMINPGRSFLDQQQDAVDFGRVVQGVKDLDETLLKELGNLVHDSGGEQILSYVEEIRAGRRLLS